jgi:hypothetical protein
MKQTDFVANAIALLRALSVTTIDSALAPVNVGSLLVGVKQFVSRLWFPFVAAARLESRLVPEEVAIIATETQATP